MSPEAEAVARVAEYRQRARLGEWVAYSTGPIDRRNPVAALVRGWEAQGLVELREEAGPEGQRWQQFRRLEADFPPGWHDVPEPLAQPPSKRDPEAVGIEWMAHWAGQGDELPEWLRYAASHYRQHLYRLAEAVRSGKLPSDAEARLAEAGLVLLTFEQMLDPAPADAFPTSKRLAVVGREITDAERARDIVAGRKPRRERMTMERARAEHRAAASVERIRAEGGHRLAAIKDAAAQHHVAQGGLGARLADRARLRDRPAALALAEAGELAGALQQGGLLQATALGLASELTGFTPADIRKALKGR